MVWPFKLPAPQSMLSTWTQAIPAWKNWFAIRDLLNSGLGNSAVFLNGNLLWTTPGGGGGGTVTSITATNPIVVTPSPITTTGVVSHAASGVTAGTYGDTSHVGQFTVDANGHLTFAQNVAIGGLGPTAFDWGKAWIAAHSAYVN